METDASATVKILRQCKPPLKSIPTGTHERVISIVQAKLSILKRSCGLRQVFDECNVNYDYILEDPLYLSMGGITE